MDRRLPACESWVYGYRKVEEPHLQAGSLRSKENRERLPTFLEMMLMSDLDLLKLAAEEPTPPSARREPPNLERIAAAFPQLEILELLGVGGMGAVYKARQKKLDRFVALKILTEAPGQGDFRERFEREGRLLAKLNHPNILTVYDFGESDGFFYLLMEYVEGVNLRQAMRSERFTPEQALGIIPEICDALSFAHEEGVLHRDIKPENILLNVKGRIKIADFGIGKLKRAGDEAQRNPRIESSVQSGDCAEYVSVSGSLTRDKEMLGTPFYAAPEQLESAGSVDQRADIYSLGVVFYELLTGELPIGRFAPPSEKSNVSRSIDPIVLKSLEKEREKRQQSAEEMKSEIAAATKSGTQPVRSAGDQSVQKESCSKILLFMIAMLVGAPYIFQLCYTFVHFMIDSVVVGRVEMPYSRYVTSIGEMFGALIGCFVSFMVLRVLYFWMFPNPKNRRPKTLFAVWGVFFLLTGSGLLGYSIFVIHEARKADSIILEQLLDLCDRLKRELNLRRENAEIERVKKGQEIENSNESETWKQKEKDSLKKLFDEQLRKIDDANLSIMKWKTTEQLVLLNKRKDSAPLWIAGFSGGVVAGILVVLASVFGWMHLSRIRGTPDKSLFWLGFFLAMLLTLPLVWGGLFCIFYLPLTGIGNTALAIGMTIGNLLGLAASIYLASITYRWASG